MKSVYHCPSLGICFSILLSGFFPKQELPELACLSSGSVCWILPPVQRYPRLGINSWGTPSPENAGFFVFCLQTSENMFSTFHIFGKPALFETFMFQIPSKHRLPSLGRLSGHGWRRLGWTVWSLKLGFVVLDLGVCCFLFWGCPQIVIFRI